MNAKDAIKTALTETTNLVSWYVSDLSDADLLVRPVPGANHIAWQLGHMIAADVQLIGGQIPGASYPELPAGFVEQHSAKNAAAESTKGFRTKAEYLTLFTKVREATQAILARLPEADLDKPTSGPMAKFAPTLGALFLLCSNHTLMHAGQFTVVRRKLGKPVLF
jgi:uncharacterized damage-inducible protein DinB